MAEEAIEQVEKPENSLRLLAKEHFGNQYFGEEPEAPKEPPKEPEVSEEVSEEVEALDDEFQEQPEEIEEQQEEEEDSGEIRSLSDLTESLRSLDLDIDDEFIDSLTTTLKVNGKDVEVSIGDLKAGGQIKEAAEDILNEAKEKRNQAAKEIEEKNNFLMQQYQTTAALIQNAEQMLAGEFQQIDWNELKKEDPSQYTIKRQEFQDRYNQIQQLKQQAGQSVQQWREQQSQQQQAYTAEQLEAEHQRLLEKIPEWRKEDVANSEKAAIVDYLTTAGGFDVEDLKDAADHRLIVLARKAMLYDQKNGKNQITEKKLKKIPKIMKPGTTQTEGQVSKKQVDSLRSKLRKSKGRDELSLGVELLKARRQK